MPSGLINSSGASIATGVGSGALPVTVIRRPGLLISVSVRSFGRSLRRNSITVPDTRTKSPGDTVGVLAGEDEEAV